MAGIPISQVVKVTPSVIAAGGGVAFLNGLILTQNTALASGAIQTFTSAADVGTTFGDDSVEYQMAEVYFTGFTNATQTPSTLLFAGYPAATAGTQATATATLTAGAVSAIAVGTAGTGYTTAPAVTLTGGGGTGATATATVSGGAVTGITVTDGGTGYTSAPTVTIAAPAGAATDPGTFMDTLVSETLNWAGFSSAFEPSLAEKQAFAQWTAAQGNRFWYVPWDTDAQAIVSGATEPFGVWLNGQSLSGVTPVYSDPMVSALALGWMASLNFSAASGRYTLKLRQNGLITPSVTSGSAASILNANGYNFYGGYAGSTGNFQFFADGTVSGAFAWADSYIGQIWLNGSFQADLINLLLNVGQIPYSTTGDSLISASVQDTINQALAFGVIRAGVTLTSEQAQQVNNAAGRTISDTIQTQGWYFQPGASTAAATVRAARTSPPCQFWYTDGGSVQSINLSSMEIQ